MKNKARKTIHYLLLGLAALACAGGLWLAMEYAPALANNGDGAEGEASANMTLEQLRDLMTANEQKMKDLEARMESQREKINATEHQIYQLEGEMSLLQEDIMASQEAIVRAAELVAEFQAELAAAQDRLVERQELLMDRVASLYIYGDIDMLDVAMGAESFEDFLTIYDMTQLIMDQDKDLILQVRDEIDNIAYFKEKAEDALLAQEDFHNRLLDKQTQLDQAKTAYFAALTEANITLDQLEANEAEIEAQQAATADLVRELISTSTLSFNGELDWPLPANWGPDCLTSDYGWRIHPIYGNQRFHTGIDIGANGGVSIFAASEGEIIFSGWNGGYGNCIMIDHGDGIVTLYAHMSAYGEYQVGSYVFQGETIGYVGTTGASTGNHLHFEVRVNGDYVSPWDYLY